MTTPTPLSGYIHSVETSSAVDGPGLRFVVFMTGCPLSCAYCHNPDTRKKKNGTLKEASEILCEIKRYAPFLKKGGGVTLSGGEPLVQPDFAEELLRGAKALGLHTALDTSGYLGMRAPDSLLDNVDLVLLDIKSGLPEVYEDVTGVPLTPTLDFARRLEGRGTPIWVRFVMVPGLTDAPENVAAVAEHIASLSNVQRVDILPFHKMGETKWRESGLAYRLFDTPTPTAEQVAAVRAIFAEHGVETVV